MQSQAAAKQPQALIRPVQPEDNRALAVIIRTVLSGLVGNEPGTVLDDPEVGRMYETYRLPRAAYFVAEVEGRAVGGAGVAPLRNGDNTTCELQKMYLLPEAQGQGIGWQMIVQCLQQAKVLGFRRCYLETFANMTSAQALYQRAGFTLLDAPLGSTGHFRCNRWYVKEL